MADCPNSPGAFQGSYVTEDGNQVVHCRKQLPCNQWDCPICNKRKIKEVRRRALHGKICNFEVPDGYRAAYYCKMITLTVPGKDFRERYTPSGALGYVQDQDLLNRLRTALKKKFGSDFEYLTVVEPQKDGYPHWHILFVGPAVVPKSFYQYINHLWHELYGMGWTFVTSQKDKKSRKFRDPRHAVNYATKYLTKTSGPIKKYSRVFSSSRNALAPTPKFNPLWLKKEFALGRVGLPDRKSKKDIPPFTVSRVVFNALDDRLKWEIFPHLYSAPYFYLYNDDVPF